MNNNEFRESFSKLTNFQTNPYHPLVWITGTPIIGKNVYIGGMSEISAKNSEIKIGDNCDIASFVAINSADSHKKCLELEDEIIRKDIIIENNVFIGTHSVILGGVYIGHHTVISAGSVVRNCKIPPFSLVINGEIKKGFYKKNLLNS